MIKSTNIGIRPVEESDVELLTELANDPFVSTMVVGWGKPLSKTQQKQWVLNQHKSETTIRLIIDDIRTSTGIGLTGLWDIDWRNQSGMTATKLLPSKIQKGYGTESIMLTMAWAFYNVGLRRLHSTILDFNSPSLAAYIKKCGWRIEGCAKEAIYRKGRWCDLYHVAILKSEFDELPNTSKYIDAVYKGDVTNTLDINNFNYGNDSN